MVDPPPTTAIRFRQFLVKYGVTRASIARAVNLTPQAIGRWANGEVIPRIENQRALAAWLNISVSQLAAELGWPDPSLNRSPDELLSVAHHVAPMLRREAMVLPIVNRLLEQPASYRLLALVGPPGIGKTTIAREVEAAAVDRLGRDRVAFLRFRELPGSDPVERLFRQIGEALDIQRDAGRPWENTIRARLSQRTALFVLIIDAFEWVAEARQELRALASSTSMLRILLTSTTRLLIDEQVKIVPPLDYPEVPRRYYGPP